FFSSRRRHTRWPRDWSSDVCSSDLIARHPAQPGEMLGVATTAKHFPGLGRVTGNTDLTGGVVDPLTAPGDPYLGSFQAAIDAGRSEERRVGKECGDQGWG